MDSVGGTNDGVADLKRELISQESKCEISELGSPTALQRFGAPFRSDAGEVAPQDSEFPILRYIFVHHVRNFPFLDRAREKEFWQDKLQVVSEHMPIDSCTLLVRTGVTNKPNIINSFLSLSLTSTSRRPKTG